MKQRNYLRKIIKGPKIIHLESKSTNIKINKLKLLEKSKRYNKLLNEGISKKNYNLARLYRLIDPLYWVDIPHWIIRNLKRIKMEKEILGKGASKWNP